MVQVVAKRLVNPAIYRFDFKHETPSKNWGWHRARDLVEAVDNLLDLQGKSTLGGTAIVRLSPNVPKKLIDCHVVNKDGSEWILTDSDDTWLRDLAASDRYLPAKIGMQILNSFKPSIVSKVLAALN